MRHALALCTRCLIVLAVLILVAPGFGCGPKKFKGKDLEMMQRVHIITDAISNYQLANAELPDSLEVIRAHVPPGEHWPVNPYNNKEIADTGSPKFDPNTSVGMVYYQKFYRDDVVVNYQLHVFGEKGKLKILGYTAFGVKE